MIAAVFGAALSLAVEPAPPAGTATRPAYTHGTIDAVASEPGPIVVADVTKIHAHRAEVSRGQMQPNFLAASSIYNSFVG